ncbi:MAG: endonuclease [Bacteroidales bacterium]|nr:endonuclease [Bacteroidales bacterium]
MKYLKPYSLHPRFWVVIFLIGFIPNLNYSQCPINYYDSAQGLTGNDLKEALHEIIDYHTEFPYSALRDFILCNTDEDPENPENLILIYSGRSEPKANFGTGNDQWNREHVWAKSHGGFGTNPPAGTDAHHIRPCDASINSSRSNLDFDNGGFQHPEAVDCYYDSDSWEPRDAVKGDIARMLFYMAVRYEGDWGELDLEIVDFVNASPDYEPLHGKLSTLLEWNQQDPPDDFEIKRNNTVYDYQHNRNPFIDHPEWVGLIWGEPVSVSKEMEVQFELSSQNGEVCLEFVNPLKTDCFFQIYNLNGQLLDEFLLVKNQKLAKSNKKFISGMYLLVPYSLSHQLKTKRFFVP